MFSCNDKINIIGLDSDNISSLSQEKQDLILTSKSIAVVTRFKLLIEEMIVNNSSSNIKEIKEIGDVKELLEWVNMQDETVSIICGGDPLWFGIGRIFSENFNRERLTFYPSPTSFQQAFSRIGRSWQDVKWFSVHGRSTEDLFNVLKKKPQSLAITTDNKDGSPEHINKVLISLEIRENYEFWIFENLGCNSEKIYKVNPHRSFPKVNQTNLVVLILSEPNREDYKNLPMFGIEDGLFAYFKDRPGLMTKREVRIQILSDLELPENGTIWDLGAGVGSVGIETIRLRPNLDLIAIDKRIGASKIIQKNCKLFNVKFKKIIEKDIIESIENNLIPKEFISPSRIILGGGEGKIKLDILKKIIPYLSINGIIIIPFSAINYINSVEEILLKNNFKTCIRSIQAYRGVSISSGTRMNPMNPIYLVKGKK